MRNDQSESHSSLGFVLRKYFVSGFVVVSFAAYAIHDRLNHQSPADAAAPVISPSATPAGQARSVATVYVPQAAGDGATTANRPPASGPPPPTPVPQGPALGPVRPTPTPPRPTPTAVPAPVAASGNYRDGQYKGNVANAFYGPLQVQVVIQNGAITDVQFVDWPHDRRTSVAINNQVMPWLRTEAIKAQSAKVNLISGATLTSRAFVESMQTALASASN